MLHAGDRAIDHAVHQLETYLETAVGADERVLRDKQVEVMTDLHEFLKTHEKEPHGYISLPTGVGKTVLFTELVKATDLRTLILMPTQGLIKQTEEAFQKFGERVDVGKVYAKEKNSDERITLSTYASFVRHSKDTESGHISPGMFDLIILDEAHRALGDETKRTLIDYEDAIQIGFTATEDYSDQRRLQRILPTEIHKMSIREAVDHELISPFVNLVIKTGVDVSRVRITPTNEYDAADLDKILNTDQRNQVALEVYLKQFNGQKTMIFCNGIEHAKAVAEVFQEAGIAAKSLNGKMSLKEQVDAKKAFASTGPDSIDVLTNDKLLAEGFDVPEVSVCFNLSPTLSRVRAQQRSGRALRLDPKNPNKVAYIVDFLDEDYRKPPVLFCDPRVAEKALVGTGTESIPNFTADSSVEIIANPELVTKMAERFYEASKPVFDYAPDGWLSSGQLASVYDVTSAIIANHLFLVDKSDTNLVNLHHSRHVGGRSQRSYYSPEVIKEIAESLNVEYIDFENTFPKGWVALESFEAQFSPRVLESIHRQMGHSGGFWSDNSVVRNETEYIGPALQRLLNSRSRPGNYLVSAQLITDKYGLDDAAIEELIIAGARKEKRLSGTFPIWCLNEGREELYFYSLSYDYILNEIARKANKPEILNDGDIIQIRARQKKAEADEINRLFQEDNHRVARKRDMKKELDAVYAAFM